MAVPPASQPSLHILLTNVAPPWYVDGTDTNLLPHAPRPNVLHCLLLAQFGHTTQTWGHG